MQIKGKNKLFKDETLFTLKHGDRNGNTVKFYQNFYFRGLVNKIGAIDIC